jgi:hypothetical protein
VVAVYVYHLLTQTFVEERPQPTTTFVFLLILISCLVVSPFPPTLRQSFFFVSFLFWRLPSLPPFTPYTVFLRRGQCGGCVCLPSTHSDVRRGATTANDHLCFFIDSHFFSGGLPISPYVTAVLFFVSFLFWRLPSLPPFTPYYVSGFAPPCPCVPDVFL